MNPLTPLEEVNPQCFDDWGQHLDPPKVYSLARRKCLLSIPLTALEKARINDLSSLIEHIIQVEPSRHTLADLILALTECKLNAVARHISDEMAKTSLSPQVPSNSQPLGAAVAFSSSSSSFQPGSSADIPAPLADPALTILSQDDSLIGLLRSKMSENQLCDLHTHLFGMGDWGFWINTVMATFVPRFISTAGELGNIQSLEYYSDLETLTPANILDIRPHFPFQRLDHTNLNRILSRCTPELTRHLKATGRYHLTLDVVYSLTTWQAALGAANVQEVVNRFNLPPGKQSALLHDLEQHWIVFNARTQKFEIRRGLTHTQFWTNYFLPHREQVEPMLKNCFTMLDPDGNPPTDQTVEKYYHGRFTPEFYPGRYALKDDIYSQYPQVLDHLLDYVLQRYQQSGVGYVEFSVGWKDLIDRPWIFKRFYQAAQKYGDLSPDKRVIVKFLAGVPRSDSIPFPNTQRFLRDQILDLEELIPKITDPKERTEKSTTLERYQQLFKLLHDGAPPQALIFNQSTYPPDHFQVLKKLDLILAVPDAGRILMTLMVGFDYMSDEKDHPYCPFGLDLYIEFANRIRHQYNRRFGFRIHFGEMTFNPQIPDHLTHVEIGLKVIHKIVINDIPLRIGHGIALLGFCELYRQAPTLFSQQLKEVIDIIKILTERRVPIEVNLRSNEMLICGKLKNKEAVRVLSQEMHFAIVLSTDNDGIWDCHTDAYYSVAAEYLSAITEKVVPDNERLQHFISDALHSRFVDPTGMQPLPLSQPSSPTMPSNAVLNGDATSGAQPASPSPPSSSRDPLPTSLAPSYANLNLAIAHLDVNAIEVFLKRKPPINLNEMSNYAGNQLCCDGWSGNSYPLCLAAHFGHYESIDLLLRHGANPKYVCSKHGAFPGRLSKGIASDEAKQRILQRVGMTQSPLSLYGNMNLAIEKLDVDAVEEFLKRKPPINLNEMSNFAGKDLCCEGYSGNAYPLCLAAHFAQYEMIRLLFINGANPNYRCSKHGSFQARLATSRVTEEAKERVMKLLSGTTIAARDEIEQESMTPSALSVKQSDSSLSPPLDRSFEFHALILDLNKQVRVWTYRCFTEATISLVRDRYHIVGLQSRQQVPHLAVLTDPYLLLISNVLSHVDGWKDLAREAQTNVNLAPSHLRSTLLQLLQALCLSPFISSSSSSSAKIPLQESADSSLGLDLHSPGSSLSSSSSSSLSPNCSFVGHFLLLASEWDVTKGGISTFNMTLATELATQPNIRVTCAVPAFTRDQQDHAASMGVTLVKPTPPPGRAPDLLYLDIEKIREWKVSHIVGHAHITGPELAHFASRGFKLILFNHILPELVDQYKESNDALKRADDKSNDLLSIAKRCDLIFSVGPRMFQEYQMRYFGKFQDAGGKIPLEEIHFQFLPLLTADFLNADVRYSPLKYQRPQCLFFGRVDDVVKVKGVDIAAIAVHRLRAHVHPAGRTASLAIRGVPPDRMGTAREDLQKVTGADYVPQFRPYASPDRLIQDLQECSLVLMPSRQEPFGLAGLEALSAGVPVLISSQSGLADFLLADETTFGNIPLPERQVLIVEMPDNEQIAIDVWSNKLIVLFASEPQFKSLWSAAAKFRHELLATDYQSRSLGSFLNIIRNQGPAK